MNKLIIVSGPTATGKTKISIEIAKIIKKKLNLNSAIVNFDSLLFYKEISIGSAKPSVEERQSIEHYLLDIESISTPLNAADYINQALSTINYLMANDTCPILVGGSAFYLRSLLKGMYESDRDQNAQIEIEEIYKKNGIEAIIDYLKIHDPQSLLNLHNNDHYRLVRAAIHHHSTKTKISDQKKEMDGKNPYDFNSIIHPWELLHIYLDLPKDLHYEIIHDRVQKMFANGLLDEINELSKKGFTLEEKPLSSIGYKEAIEYLKGQFPGREQCIERIAISTRQLAKSQRTFFNKIHPKHQFNPLTEEDKIFSLVEQFLR